MEMDVSFIKRVDEIFNESNKLRLMVQRSTHTLEMLNEDTQKMKRSYEDISAHINNLEKKIKETQELYNYEKQNVASIIKERIELPDQNEHVVATTVVTVPYDSPVTAKSFIESMRPPTSILKMPHTNEQNLPISTPSLNDADSETLSSGDSKFQILERPYVCLTSSSLHNWKQKSYVMGEICSICCKRIKFSSVAFKCSNCKAIAHSLCKEDVPVPCTPLSPDASNNICGSKAGCITDYVPRTPPLIPSLIICCIKEIEARGLNKIGLYRVASSDKEVKLLKERLFEVKDIIKSDLSKHCVHTIGNCLKAFLYSLEEGLILKNKWKEFSCASEIQNGEQKKNKIFKLLLSLPQANRDSLAFIVLHLQRVAATPKCKMPVANLSKVFGPIIVGYSKCDPDNYLIETIISNKIMAELLLLPTECWEEILYPGDNENQNTDLMKTLSESRSHGFFSNSISSMK